MISSPLLQNQTILIVDDLPSNLEFIVTYLETRNYKVVIARAGEEALQRALYVKPDLILLDVMMPGMDGFQTCRKLKELEETKDIPVIFMTALEEPSHRIKGFEAGAVDYVTKPIQIEEFLLRVNMQLELRATQKQIAAQNERLQQEIEVRKKTESALQNAYEDLEIRVAMRTNQLAQANVTLTEEINERIYAQQALKNSADEILDLYNNAPCGYHSIDENGFIVQINDTELKWLGASREEVIGKKKFSDFLDNDSVRTYMNAFERLKVYGAVNDIEFKLLPKNRNPMYVLLTASAIRDVSGKFQMSRSMIYDITERKEQEERIHYMAHHDMLTGLSNRTLIKDRVEHSIALAQRNNSLVAMLFIDLDNFKNINDSLGHQIGDRVLQSASERLKRCVREVDSVGRLGGDEFIINLPGIHDVTDAVVVAEKILNSLDIPFIIDDHQLHIGASVGISIYPNDGDTAETLMRTADTAMYHAKEKGKRNYQFYTPSLNLAVMQRLAKGNQLRKALSQHQFVLHYQPQIDLQTGKIFSIEALLRWQQGSETISCNEFISVAEETGLILPLGEWALRTACKQLQIWRDTKNARLRIAINVSSRQFYQAGFLDIVKDALDDAHLSPSALELEITEHILMKPHEDNLATLKKLSGMGIQLSIDDFGVGYSSLSYLQQFPINALKIDKSFVAGIDNNPNDVAIVTAIIAMAQSLQLKIVAEGVENASQINFLKSKQCPAAQGFYYSVPISTQDFTDMLEKKSELFV